MHTGISSYESIQENDEGVSRGTKKVIDKRVKTLTHWSDEAEDEFRRIFGVPSEKIITIKFKLNGEVTKETKSARAVIQEAVDRMKFICDKLSADKGSAKKLLL